MYIMPAYTNVQDEVEEVEEEEEEEEEEDQEDEEGGGQIFQDFQFS